jgi:hypothetical protein
MELRRLVVAHPLPTILTVAAAVAAAWASSLWLSAGLSGETLRVTALSTVLSVFAAGFWVGPAAAWYDDRQ